MCFLKWTVFKSKAFCLLDELDFRIGQLLCSDTSTCLINAILSLLFKTTINIVIKKKIGLFVCNRKKWFKSQHLNDNGAEQFLMRKQFCSCV